MILGQISAIDSSDYPPGQIGSKLTIMCTGQIEHRIIVLDITAAKLPYDIGSPALVQFPSAVGVPAIDCTQCNRGIRIPTNDSTSADRIVAEHRANHRWR